MWNLSNYSLSNTATTCTDCAEQRAEHLHILGVKKVLELCVGPSLPTLEAAYRPYGIEVTGNDIDPRYQLAYPAGRWRVGDAMTPHIAAGMDAVVVAPPLSKGCSGRREDALSVDEVLPSYYDFYHLSSYEDIPVVVYVLPGKTLSIKEDRKQLHRFLRFISDGNGVPEVVPLVSGVTKYVDVYVTKA